jgi:hypothetical protein
VHTLALVLVAIVGMLSIALITAALRPLKPTPPPASPRIDPIVIALQDAFAECGLPVHEFNQYFDLARTGKLNDVLHHASLKLGIEHPMRTVGDVAAYLRQVN